MQAGRGSSEGEENDAVRKLGEEETGFSFLLHPTRRRAAAQEAGTKPAGREELDEKGRIGSDQTPLLEDVKLRRVVTESNTANVVG